MTEEKKKELQLDLKYLVESDILRLKREKVYLITDAIKLLIFGLLIFLLNRNLERIVELLK